MFNIIAYKRVFFNLDLGAAARQPLPLGCAPDVSKAFVHFYVRLSAVMVGRGLQLALNN
jgi:hypothetical protein